MWIRYIRLICFLVAVLSLGACKIQVEVPSGGKVVTRSGIFECRSNQICTLDVSDIYFDETFAAVPDAGYQFQGWRKSNRYFCGGNKSDCRLYTSGFTGNDKLLAFLKSNERFYLSPIFAKTNTSSGSFSQGYKSSKSFPGDFVKEHWDNGLYITAVSGNNGSWTVMMSKVEGYSGQSYFFGSTFPKDKISEAWAAGRQITEVAFKNGSWLVTSTGGSGFSSQRWATRSEFPDDKIDQYWDEGYRITDIAYGDGIWALVASKVTGFGSQAYRISSSFPKSFISEYWNLGYEITELTYGGGSWVVLMTNANVNSAQSYVTRSDFPANEIRRDWDAGRDILDIVYGGGVYAEVSTKHLSEVVGTGTGTGTGTSTGTGTGTGTGTSTLKATFTDACNDGRPVDYKFFDKTNNLIWPGSTQHWSAKTYNSKYSHNLSCRTGASICYGAGTDTWHWGLGLKGDKGCESCCVTCGNVSKNWSVGC